MIDVKHIAKLANLPLTNKELNKFAKQLAQTIDSINQLREINTEDTAPTSQVTGKTNELREDKTTPSLLQEQALKNGGKIHNGFFVSKVVWD